MVEQSYHGVLSGDEDLKHHTLQPGAFVYWKRYLQKDSSVSLERPLSGTANQPLCCQTPGNRFLDSCDTPKENAERWLDLHIFWWPENKDFLELKQVASDDTAFPSYLDQACWKFVCQTIDDDIMFHMISNVYDLDPI